MDVVSAPGQEAPVRALLLIDLQNAYFEFPELAAERERVVDRSNQLIAAARSAGLPIVLVRTEHEPDGSTWTVSMLDDGQGFAFPGTEQAAYLDDLDCDGCSDVTKTRDDAFFGTRLQEHVESVGVTHVLIGGVSTHSCVAQTATSAFARDLRVSVAGEAIASDNSELSEAMLDFLTDALRQPVLDQEQSLAWLREGPTR